MGVSREEQGLNQSNKYYDKDELDRFVNSKNAETRLFAANRNDLGIDHIEKLLDDPDERVRRAVERQMYNRNNR